MIMFQENLEQTPFFCQAIFETSSFTLKLPNLALWSTEGQHVAASERQSDELSLSPAP